MKTKNLCSAFIFLLGTLYSLQGIPMEEVSSFNEEEFLPSCTKTSGYKNELLSTKKNPCEVMSSGYSSIPGMTCTDVNISPLSSKEALTEKINLAQSATKFWQQKQEEVELLNSCSKSPMNLDAVESLTQEALATASYWDEQAIIYSQQSIIASNRAEAEDLQNTTDAITKAAAAAREFSKSLNSKPAKKLAWNILIGGQNKTKTNDSSRILSPLFNGTFTPPLLNSLLTEKEQNSLIAAIETKVTDTSENLKKYQNADACWKRTQEAWDKRSTASLEAKYRSKVLQEHRELLEQAKIIRETTDLNKTPLGRFARFTGIIANGASLTGFPPLVVVSGFFSGISSIANGANHYKVYHEYKKTKQAEKKSTKQFNVAQEAYESAKTKAPELEEQATELESQAQATVIQATINDAKKIRPPSSNNNSQSSWLLWASSIVQFAGCDLSLAPKLMNQGIQNPLWANKIVATAWNKRLRTSEEALKKLESDENSDQQKNLKLLDNEFLQARQKIDVLQKQIATSKKELETITEERNYYEQSLSKAHEELDALEQGAKTPQTSSNIQKQKRKICSLTETLQESSKQWALIHQKTESECLALAKQEVEAVQNCNIIFESYTAAGKLLERSIKRAKIDVTANQIAKRTFWPQLDEAEKTPSIAETLGDLEKSVQKGIEIFSQPPTETGSSKKQPSELVVIQKNREFEEAENKALTELKPELNKAREIWKDLSEKVSCYGKSKNTANNNAINTAIEAITTTLEKVITSINKAYKTNETSTPEAKAFYEASVAMRSLSIIASKNLASEVHFKNIALRAQKAAEEASKTTGTPWEEEARWAATIAEEAVRIAKTVGSIQNSKPTGTAPLKILQNPQTIIPSEKNNTDLAPASLALPTTVDASNLLYANISETPNLPVHAIEKETVNSALVDADRSEDQGSPMTLTEQIILQRELISLEKNETLNQKERLLEARQFAAQKRTDLLKQGEAYIAREKALTEERTALIHKEKELFKRLQNHQAKHEENNDYLLESTKALCDALEQKKTALAYENTLLEKAEIVREEAIKKLEHHEEHLEEASMTVALREEAEQNFLQATITETEKASNELQEAITEKKKIALAQKETEQKALQEKLLQQAHFQEKKIITQREANTQTLQRELDDTKLLLQNFTSKNSVENQAPFTNRYPENSDLYSKLLNNVLAEENRLTREIAKFEAQTKKQLLVQEFKKSASESRFKGAKAKAESKTAESTSWNQAGNSFDKAAQNITKSMNAAFLENEDIAKQWYTVALQQEKSGRFFTKAAEYASVNAAASDSWMHGASISDHVAAKLEKCIYAYEEKEPQVAKQWHEIAQQQKCSINLFSKAAMTYHSNANWEEGDRWEKAGHALSSAAEKLAAAILVNGEEAQKLNRTAAEYKHSAELYIKGALGYLSKKDSKEINRWEDAATSFHDAAEKLAESMDLSENAPDQRAEQALSIALLHHQSGELAVEAALTYARGKIDLSNTWKDLRDKFNDALKKLEDAFYCKTNEEAILSEIQLLKNTAAIQKLQILLRQKAHKADIPSKNKKGLSAKERILARMTQKKAASSSNNNT